MHLHERESGEVTVSPLSVNRKCYLARRPTNGYLDWANLVAAWGPLEANLVGGLGLGVLGALGRLGIVRPTWLGSLGWGLWKRLGFPIARMPKQVVVTPACGLAGASGPFVRSTLKACREAGRRRPSALPSRSAVFAKWGAAPALDPQNTHSRSTAPSLAEGGTAGRHPTTAR